MNSQYHVFRILYKSRFNLSKSTVEEIIKELNDEIRYQSTIALPNCQNRIKKQNILENIERLRKQRDNILRKFDEDRFPRNAGGINANPETESEHFANKHISKSISKADILRALYQRAFGTLNGLNENDIANMPETEMNERIEALQKIFE